MLFAAGTGIQQVQTGLQLLDVTQESWEDMVVLESSEDRRVFLILSLG